MKLSQLSSKAGWVALVSMTAALAACGAPASVGDTYLGGKIVSIDHNAGCSAITIEYAPTWTCTTEEIAEVQSGSASGGGSGDYPGGGPVPSGSGGTPPATEAVELQPTDCESLANLRRPGIKSQQETTLRAQRRSLLGANCFARRDTKYIDDRGAQVSYCYAGQQ